MGGGRWERKWENARKVEDGARERYVEGGGRARDKEEARERGDVRKRSVWEGKVGRRGGFWPSCKGEELGGDKGGGGGSLGGVFG